MVGSRSSPPVIVGSCSSFSYGGCSCRCAIVAASIGASMRSEINAGNTSRRERPFHSGVCRV